MFETSRVPYHSVDGEALTLNVIFPMASSEGMFRPSGKENRTRNELTDALVRKVN